jgi:peptidoglycan/LPS O-acetylase OafA/YrhL
LEALTGIRPFASACVFFFHFGQPLVAGAPSWLRALGSSGFVAVSFFYVLSGFVLTTSQRQALADGRFVHRHFLARRLGRLLPAHLLTWVVMLPLALWPALGGASGAFVDAPPRRIATALLHLPLLQSWWPSLVWSWNVPAWSISVELAFYLLFPTLVRALQRLPRRRLPWVIAGWWIASLAVTGAYSALLPDGAVDADRGAAMLDFIKYWPPLRLPEFACGVTLALWFDERQRAPRALGPIALAVALLTLTQAERLPYAMLHNSLLLPAFVALVWSVASARGPIARALSARPLVRLGRASYEVYIVQMPLMYWLMVATHAEWIEWRGVTFVVRFAVVVVAVALGLYRLVERRWQPLAERALERAFAAMSAESSVKRGDAWGGRGAADRAD